MPVRMQSQGTVQKKSSGHNSVRQIVWVDSNVIGLGIVDKAYGGHMIQALQESFADSVHSIHNSAVCGENDRKCKVGFQHKTCMVDDLAAS
jgi:hypothetical protein